MVDNTKYDLLNSIINDPLDELIYESANMREQEYGNKVDICGIINAKSGLCGEDCKFCAQSVHYNTEITQYSLLKQGTIIDKALRLKRLGADHFGIVTSGNTLTSKDIETLSSIISILVKEVNIEVCGSFGALEQEDLLHLKRAGMTRYHHNIETSRKFYPNIVTTHKYDERLNTVRRAKGLGLKICSGGILGLGETWQDRMDMAQTLKDLDVDTIPLNFLVPIEGTPLEKQKKISEEEALRSIVLFRKVLKNKSIKVMAGREKILKDKQKLLYEAGANGMLIDGYLTVSGRSVESDIELIKETKRSWKDIT